MIGSDVLGTSFIGYAGALVCLLLSLVLVIVSLVLLTLACSPKGNPRNITLNSITIILAAASAVLFTVFSNGITAVFPEFISGKLGIGIFVYIALLAALLILNIVIAKKGVDVKYKQCYVGGIPAEEYFELVANGTDVETIHEMMAKALEEKAVAKETAEAK